MHRRLPGRSRRLNVCGPGRNVRNSAGEAWVAEADPTSTVDRSSETCVRRTKAAASEVPAAKTTSAEASSASKVSATATTEVTATATTKMTTAAATAVASCPSGVCEGDRCDAD
jgi:hypothetical protein